MGFAGFGSPRRFAHLYPCPGGWAPLGRFRAAGVAHAYDDQGGRRKEREHEGRIDRVALQVSGKKSPKDDDGTEARQGISHPWMTVDQGGARDREDPREPAAHQRSDAVLADEGFYRHTDHGDAIGVECDNQPTHTGKSTGSRTRKKKAAAFRCRDSPCLAYRVGFGPPFFGSAFDRIGMTTQTCPLVSPGHPAFLRIDATT